MLRLCRSLYNGTIGSLCAAAVATSGIPAFAPAVNAEETDVPTYINWNDERQEIDGFGICEAFRQSNKIQELSEEKQKLVLDSMFSTTDGAGISIVRNIIGDGGVRDDGTKWGYEDDGPTDSIEPEEGQWSWTGDESQIWVMKEAQKRGCERFFSTAWSPPAWMKTTNSVIQGELKPDKYQAYAEYLAEYIKGYKEHHGIDIYAVSVANEPDYAAGYSSCLWSGEQFKTFLKENLGPTFERENLDVKVIIPETTGFGNRPEYFIPTLEDTDALAAMDIVAMHGYGGSSILPVPIVHEKNKKLWMTEIGVDAGGTNDMKNGIAWARNVHEYLTVADLNAYISFWGAAIKPGEDCCFIAIDKRGDKAQDPDVIIYKRLYTFGNFSRFVRPGYVRIGTNGTPSANTYISAYKDPQTGKFAVVAINNSKTSQPAKFTLNGFNAESVTPYRTSDTENLAELTPIASSGGSIDAELAPMSVTTFVGDGAAADDVNDIIYPAESITAAEYYSDINGGIHLEQCANGGGHDLGYIVNGDYVGYDSVDFGSGVTKFSVNASSGSGGGNIELHLDSPDGTLIDTVKVDGTGSWDRYVTVSKELTADVTGLHKLYLKFTGSGGNLMNMKWWSFNPNLADSTEESGSINPYIRNEAEDYCKASGGIRIEDNAAEGQRLGYITNNSWAVYRDVEFGTGADSFNINLASATDGGAIELHLDSLDGQIIGTVQYSGGTNWDEWTEHSCDVSGVKDTHDLYLKFTGAEGDAYNPAYLFNVDWWQFAKTELRGIIPEITDKTVSNGRCDVTINVVNHTDENVAGKTVIAAVYDKEGVLKDTKLFNFNANIESGTNFYYTFDEVPGGEIKVFVWDNIDDMNPVNEPITRSLDE